ncbi:hypothetical protein DIPPA_35598 [Diplonema papillatum]|nr:hypothetical protein DIPPA_35598 [Diplonema papillatum]
MASRKRAAGPAPLALNDLIHPMDADAFKEEFWGKTVYATKMRSAAFEELSRGFGNGDLEQIIPCCRKDNNAPYTPEEMREMEQDYEECKKTLSFPLCYTEGADALRTAFLEACEGFGNDVEVGAYCSRPGAPAATWHSDNNHNITIQLCGSKDWSTIAGSPHTVCSKGMLEPPRNRFEQDRVVPALTNDNVVTYSLTPGSVIYIPPGCWHSVVATGDEGCISADLRVGNVLHAKWICEALFAGLLSAFHKDDNALTISAISPDDYQRTSDGMQRQIRYLSQNLSKLVSQCRMPRAFPFERAYSDGLTKGASLDYLIARNFMASRMLRGHDVVSVNELVAFRLKQRDSEQVVLHLFSESSLSSMEYLRFSLFCDIDLRDALATLFQKASVLVEQLQAVTDDTKKLESLIRVLLHANVVHIPATVEGNPEDDNENESVPQTPVEPPGVSPEPAFQGKAALPPSTKKRKVSRSVKSNVSS